MGAYSDTYNNINDFSKDKSVGDNTALTIGLTSKIVGAFESLVNYAKNLSEASPSSTKETIDTALEAVSDTLTGKIFTKSLYKDASSLSESEQLVFEYLDKFSSSGYGHFRGGTTYLTFDGIKDVDKDSPSTSNKPPSDGWFTLSEYTGGSYGIFNGDGNSYIISQSSFEPQAIISDFTPLYILLSAKVQKSRIKDDIKSIQSKLTNNKQEVSESINNNTDPIMNIVIDEPVVITSSSKNNSGAGEPPTEAPLDNTVSKPEPTNIETSQDQSTDVDESTKEIYLDGTVQAIVFDIPNGTRGSFVQLLRCFQQPDNVSYHASSSYDPVSTRGSQQPMQFYQSANAIELSFTLRWHKSELYTLYNNYANSENSVCLTFADIANMAESFTRPWKHGSSIIPKEVGVILPGMTAKGYMTTASITYSGSMVGDVKADTSDNSDDVRGRHDEHITDDGMLNISNDRYWKGYKAFTDEHGATKSVTVYDYNYDTLEIQFSMTVIKDVVLHSRDEAKNKKDLEKKKDSNTDTSNENVASEFGWASKDYIELYKDNKHIIDAKTFEWQLPDGTTVSFDNRPEVPSLTKYDSGYSINNSTDTLYLPDGTEVEADSYLLDPVIGTEWAVGETVTSESDTYFVSRAVRTATSLLLYDGTSSQPKSLSPIGESSGYHYYTNGASVRTDGQITFKDGRTVDPSDIESYEIDGENIFTYIYYIDDDSVFTSKGVGTVVTTSSDLNVRKEPSEKAKKIGTLKRNSTVEILGEEGNWYKVPLSSVKKVKSSKSSSKSKKSSTQNTPRVSAVEHIVGSNTDTIYYEDGTTKEIQPVCGGDNSLYTDEVEQVLNSDDGISFDDGYMQYASWNNEA